MKNVKFLVKLRRLVKSLAVSVFILLMGMAVTAFKAEATDTENHNGKETAPTDKNGFKSLFSASSFALDEAMEHHTQMGLYAS